MGTTKEDKKMKTKIYLVNSLKGGVGKTSIGIAKALEEVRSREQGSEEEESKVLFVDFDFVGSGSNYLFVNRGEEESIKYLDELYPSEEGRKNEVSELINTIKVDPITDEKRKLDYLIFSSEPQCREKYKRNANTIFIKDYFYEVFIRGFLGVVKKYEAVIIDLSQGYDEIAQKFVKVFADKGLYDCNVLFISSLASVSIEPSIEKLNALKTPKTSKIFENIDLHLIINDPLIKIQEDADVFERKALTKVLKEIPSYCTLSGAKKNNNAISCYGSTTTLSASTEVYLFKFKEIENETDIEDIIGGKYDQTNKC